MTTVGHVEKRVAIHTENSEREIGEAVVVSMECRRRSRICRRLEIDRRRVPSRRRLVRVWLRFGRAWGFQMRHQASTIPAIGDSVGNVPPVIVTDGRLDDPDACGDTGQSLGNRLRGRKSRFVSIRPDEHLSPGER